MGVDDFVGWSRGVGSDVMMTSCIVFGGMSTGSENGKSATWKVYEVFSVVVTVLLAVVGGLLTPLIVTKMSLVDVSPS